MYYNWEQGRVGHVFQDRFRSEWVEDEGYYWGLIRYIHLNPVKAHMVKSAEEYPWSSMQDYLAGESELLAEKALTLKQDNFKDNSSFLKMHEEEDLRIYLEIKEELDEIKKTAGHKLIDMTLAGYGVISITELRDRKEGLESLLGNLARELKMSYQEIAKLTGLSYSMVQRIVSKYFGQ